MRTPEPVAQTDLEGLDLVSRGKVRDIYALGDGLLIVATDRISCFDVVLRTAIPGKGKVLTHLTEFWLRYLKDLTPNHLITADVDAMGPLVAPHRRVLRGRSMLVKRAKVLPVECVVRGYLSPAPAGVPTGRTAPSAASACPPACARATGSPSPSSPPPARPSPATTCR